jgi:putative ABC transport system substrate-binding protein
MKTRRTTGNEVMLIIGRREFIAGLGSAAVSPLAARAQQPAVPLVGYLNITSPELGADMLAAFRKGLGETGYIEGRNVAIELHWVENRIETLPALAADLVRRRVAVIFANSPPAARAAKAATAIVPIVFTMGEDPVEEGIVEKLNRPGGNVTGFSDFNNLLAGKQFGLLHEIVPKAAVFAVLVNPANPNAEVNSKQAQAAADALGVELQVLRASTERDIESGFAAMLQLRVGALLIAPDTFLSGRREQIATLAARHAIPTIHDQRYAPAAGFLMSYGANRLETHRQAGIYVGRILKGVKAGDLPVQQSTKFQFVINLKTAKALNLEIPPGMLAIADEVIE